MLPHLLQTLDKQRLELLLAAAKDGAKRNAEQREALEAKVKEVESKLRGEEFQRMNMVAAHNAAQAELRQRTSFLQILNDDFEKVAPSLPGSNLRHHSHASVRRSSVQYSAVHDSTCPEHMRPLAYTVLSSVLGFPCSGWLSWKKGGMSCSGGIKSWKTKLQ